MSTNEIDNILEERGARYGSFKEHAYLSQSLQEVLWESPNWYKIPLDTRQALCTIMDKVSRCLNGEPDYVDTFVDIIGYSTLVLNRIKAANRES